MRNAFADELGKMMAEDSSIVMLSADIGNKLFDKIKTFAPERVINTGVAEANTIGVAAGIAKAGMKPIAYTITPFITSRCLEQIRVDLAYHNLPVLVVGTGSGLSYATLGATHHSLEDISFLRSIPNMTVIAPADSNELRALLREALKLKTPVYIRIGKKGEPVIYESVPDVKIGQAKIVKKGNGVVCLLSTGVMLSVALDSAKILEKENPGLDVEVVSFHTIKPLDKDFLSNAFSRNRIVATIEEHGLSAGFGSAVAEWLCDNASEDKQARLIRFGTKDEFLPFNADQEYAREYFGISSPKIAEQIRKSLK